MRGDTLETPSGIEGGFRFPDVQTPVNDDGTYGIKKKTPSG